MESKETPKESSKELFTRRTPDLKKTPPRTTPDFVVGDFIYKINNGQIDHSAMYRIMELAYEEGGSFHDGYSRTTYATLDNGEKTMIMYDCNMVHRRCVYAVLAKPSRAKDSIRVEDMEDM
jgi:hypothetical protein